MKTTEAELITSRTSEDKLTKDLESTQFQLEQATATKNGLLKEMDRLSAMKSQIQNAGEMLKEKEKFESKYKYESEKNKA